jgi:hypothetical protein
MTRRARALLLALSFCAIAGLLAPRASRGLSRAPLQNVDALLARTTAVVDAVVGQTTYTYSRQDGPWKRRALHAVRVIAGRAPSDLGVYARGGPNPDGTMLVVPGETELLGGQRYLLFLAPGPHGPAALATTPITIGPDRVERLEPAALYLVEPLVCADLKTCVERIEDAAARRDALPEWPRPASPAAQH